MLLELREVHTHYELSHILFGISLSVEQGRLVCLLGRNGAGKSTTFRSIMGLTPPAQGSILFKGQNIAGRPPHKIARLGIGYVPEERLVFFGLTVRENLDIGARIMARKNGVANTWNLERIWEAFPRLHQMEDRKGGYLSGGEQQMLAIARTLMGNPELLLLDEPCEGLAPLIVKMLGELIVAVSQAGNTILLAEQNARFALDVAELGYIMEKGMIKYYGSAEELRNNEEIKNKFLAVKKV